MLPASFNKVTELSNKREATWPQRRRKKQAKGENEREKKRKKHNPPSVIIRDL